MHSDSLKGVKRSWQEETVNGCSLSERMEVHEVRECT